MSQTIIHVPDAGIHNANLAQSIERIQREGVWKKQRCVHVIPVASSGIPPKVAASQFGLIKPPNQGFFPIVIENAEVGKAYDTAIEVVLGNPVLRDTEYVFFTEHDNIPLPDGLIKLIAAMEKYPEYAAISGLYWTKGPGGVPQIWGDISDPIPNYRPQMPEAGKVIECYGIGQGFALFRTSMFVELEKKKVERPWFKTVCSAEEGCGTQDLYFWGKVGRPNGFRCAVDCSVLVGHYDPVTGQTW